MIIIFYTTTRTLLLRSIFFSFLRHLLIKQTKTILHGGTRYPQQKLSKQNRGQIRVAYTLIGPFLNRVSTIRAAFITILLLKGPSKFMWFLEKTKTPLFFAISLYHALFCFQPTALIATATVYNDTHDAANITKREPIRILYTVTTLSEYDNGTRETIQVSNCSNV
jgi:hypothetical protein